MKKFVLSFSISLICFGLLFTWLDGSLLFKSNSIMASDGSEDFDDQSKAGNSGDTMELNKKEYKEELLFLLMGIDGDDVSKSKGYRTDTMILAKVNFDDGSINLLSIPRDSRVYVKGKRDKITHAHAYGGSELAIRTVREFLNIDLEYFVKVDYQVVKGIVDAIGGIDIDVPVRMKYSDPKASPPLKIDLQPGIQELNGQKAHDFLRFRGYKSGDVGRVEAQQYFMTEFIKQSLRIKNIPQIPKMVEEYYKNVETNIPLTTMLRAAASASNLDIENMNTFIIPGEGKYVGDTSYYLNYETETKKLIEENFGEYLFN